MMHRPVLLTQSINALRISPQGLYIDGTFGRGGHARGILSKLGDQGRLIALDQDPEAVAAGLADAVLSVDARFSVHQGNFEDVQSLLKAISVDLIGQIDGVLLDLGVSSPQLDDARRGFSFQKDGPLDMRMNPNQGVDAATWLNAAKEADIADMIYAYGEERCSRRIARLICLERAKRPLQTTRQLARIVQRAVPTRENNKHPATRTFQALRILVNQELTVLAQGLVESLSVLKPGARLAVISFHSLEDRIVKRFMREQQTQGALRIIGSAIKSTEEDIKQNRRARSAVLRVAEKV